MFEISLKYVNTEHLDVKFLFIRKANLDYSVNLLITILVINMEQALVVLLSLNRS